MIRQGTNDLQPGDVVEMSTSRLPSAGRFKAAVESVGEGQFSAFTFDLQDYDIGAEDLTFDKDKPDYQIFSLQKSEIAVPTESAGFKKGDLVRSTDGLMEGYVIAALDGFLYMISQEGEDWTCGSNHLVKVESI